MQKLKKYLCIAVATLMLCSCSSNDTAGTDSKVQNPVIQQTEEQHVPVQIKTSDDKHIAYIKDYVGKNCASFGYYSLGGDRMDRFGNGYIELIFVTADGTYVDIENDDDLKQYVVVAQNYEPNTEVRFTFDVDSRAMNMTALWNGKV